MVTFLRTKKFKNNLIEKRLRSQEKFLRNFKASDRWFETLKRYYPLYRKRASTKPIYLRVPWK